ncbi:MAG: hypothetical protein NTY68_02450 [Candidatus Micrarchaeota archaeon]|nr:hypothetical protein [Candidatus Micrarchaeota archaeon]
MAENMEKAAEPKRVMYTRKFTKKERLNIFHGKADDHLVEMGKKCADNQMLQNLFAADPKLKIIFNSIIGKDKQDPPWFTSNIVAEAYQMFNSDNISDCIREIDARIDALEEINYELMGMGYNALKDFKYVSTIYSMINSQLFTIRDVNQSALCKTRIVTDQQKKDIDYTNTFKTSKSWPRIMTYLSSTCAALGVTTAAFASSLRTAIEGVVGNSNMAMALGTGAFVVSTTLFATGQLIDFFVNRSIKSIIDRADKKMTKIMKERDDEVNKRLKFLRVKSLELQAHYRYYNGVKKEEPAIADAAEREDWDAVDKWMDEAISGILANEGEKVPFGYSSYISSKLVERATAEVGGLDGNPSPSIHQDSSRP